jgi:hypothetical protein
VPRGIDLTHPPLEAGRPAWTHPTEYGPCQELADAARRADIAAIRYESVRDPEARANVALLTCRAFASSAPRERQSWRLRLSPRGVQALCEAPEARLEFPRAAFAADPRLAGSEHAGARRPSEAPFDRG